MILWRVPYYVATAASKYKHMKKVLYTFLVIAFLSTAMTNVFAGNPDRQGEAGAYELLMIPYAKMAGLHALTTSCVSGVEAIRLNPAGLGRIENMEISLSSGIYLQGTGINMSAAGYAKKLGENSAFGFSLMSLNFGDIEVRTTDQPEGTGFNYSPGFFNLGLSYAHTFANKVSVGMTVRGVSESTSDVSAFAFALDAGVQYVSGEMDNFKFGISLKNIGSKMKFGGEALNSPADSPNGGYQLTLSQRSAGFDLPSQLNIGGSYDFYFGKSRLSAVASFTSNSFARDQVGGGLEFSLNDRFVLRSGYKVDLGDVAVEEQPIYSGLSVGATVKVPVSKKEGNKSNIAIDYAYRQTTKWNATHNVGVRIGL